MGTKHESTNAWVQKKVIKALKLKPRSIDVIVSQLAHKINEWRDSEGRVYFREVVNIEPHYKTSEFKRSYQNAWLQNMRDQGIL